MNSWTLISEASPLVKIILLILLSASILSWGIIFSKLKLIKLAIRENNLFLEQFWNSNALEDIHSKLEAYPHAPIAKVFAAGFKELRKLPVQERSGEGQAEIHNISRALNRAHSIEIEGLESHVDWLASIASAAPFVGLFGTVWGIMSSFQNIGATGSASLAVVAPGISEALIATAIGLGAAIPAAIFYNYLINRFKKISSDADHFSQEFLNLVQRSLLVNKKGTPSHANEHL